MPLATANRPNKNRTRFILFTSLFLLILPIAWTAMGGIDSLPHFLGLFALAWLGLSGPLLLLYSLIVHQFVELKGKALFWITALAIGLPWTILILYKVGTMNLD